MKFQDLNIDTNFEFQVWLAIGCVWQIEGQSHDSFPEWWWATSEWWQCDNVMWHTPDVMWLVDQCDASCVMHDTLITASCVHTLEAASPGHSTWDITCQCTDQIPAAHASHTRRHGGHFWDFSRKKNVFWTSGEFVGEIFFLIVKVFCWFNCEVCDCVAGALCIRVSLLQRESIRGHSVEGGGWGHSLLATGKPRPGCD